MYVDSETVTLVAVAKSNLELLFKLAIEHNIELTEINSGNAYSFHSKANEFEYWNSSSC